MRLRLAVPILLLPLSGALAAQDYKSRLQASPSLESVREFCAKFSRFGEVREGTYSSAKTRLFMCWTEHAGTDVPGFLFGYVERNGKWHLAIDHPENSLVAGSMVVLSPSQDSVLLLAPDGKTVRTYSLMSDRPNTSLERTRER